jgi:hypothetical protein
MNMGRKVGIGGNVKTGGCAFSTRREFLQGLFPAGAMLCSGCGLLSAVGRVQDSPQNKDAQHKFLGDSGLTTPPAWS